MPDNKIIRLEDIVTTHTVPKLKWIDIDGYQKAGKTKWLVELSKHVPTLYCDFDIQGTKPYKGDFVHVGLKESKQGQDKIFSILQFCTEIIPSMPLYGKRILVLDPWNKFVDQVKDQLMTQFDVEDLKDHKIPGVGNGWNIFYDKILTYLQMFFETFDLVITVTHLKIDKYFIGDTIAVQGANLDLPGRIYQITQSNADCHLLFTSKKEGDKYITLVNEDSSAGLIRVPLGSRDYKFVKRIHTGEDFVREITKMFGVTVTDLGSEEPEEIKFS